MDNRFEADNEIMEILYGTHRDCLNCTRQCMELQGHRVSNLTTRRRPSLALTIRRQLTKSFSSVSEGVLAKRGNGACESELTDTSNLVATTAKENMGNYDACCSTKTDRVPYF